VYHSPIADTDTTNKRNETMKITITTINETGKNGLVFKFDNSIDANKERDMLDAAGIDYRVEWSCK
jgi:hypothetical protein